MPTCMAGIGGIFGFVLDREQCDAQMSIQRTGVATMSDHDTAKLERFSDAAGEAVTRTNRGAGPLSGKHVARFIALKSQNEAKQSRYEQPPRQRMFACA